MYGSYREPQLWRTSTLIHRLPFAQHSHRSSDGIAWRYCALSPVANASRSFRRHTGTSGPFTCRQSAHQALRLWLDSQVVYAKRQPSNLWACCNGCQPLHAGVCHARGFLGLADGAPAMGSIVRSPEYLPSSAAYSWALARLIGRRFFVAMAWAACCVFSINSGCSTRSFIRAATACGSCRPLSKVTQEIQMA